MNSKGLHVYGALQQLRDEDHCRSSLLQTLPLTHLVEEEVSVPRVSTRLMTTVISIVQGLKWRDQCPCFIWVEIFLIELNSKYFRWLITCPINLLLTGKLLARGRQNLNPNLACLMYIWEESNRIGTDSCSLAFPGLLSLSELYVYPTAYSFRGSML